MHRGRVTFLSRSAAIVLLAPLLLASTCPKPKAKKPASDPNPPTLTWSVMNRETNATQELPANATLTAKLGDLYSVVLRANNPGGIHEIDLGGTSAWSCHSKDIPQGPEQSRTPELKTDTNTLNPDADGNVETSTLTSRNIGLQFDCPDGYWYDTGSETLTGTASNYYGVTATATLVFRVPNYWTCTDPSVTVYGSSYADANNNRASACAYSDMNCSQSFSCTPAPTCTKQWACWVPNGAGLKVPTGTASLRGDDLTALWKNTVENCRQYATAQVGDAAFTVCYKAVQCVCGAD